MELIEVGTEITEDEVCVYEAFMKDVLGANELRVVWRRRREDGMSVIKFECIGDMNVVAMNRLRLRKRGLDVVWECDYYYIPY
jgi:hypothetical protein